MNLDDCTRIGLLAPAAALGAVDPDEAALLRTHRLACARPHPELREWVVVAAEIGAAVPEEHRPSAGLRDRVLAAARGT